MAVRFVIGRAGTGKTALCVREIRAHMLGDPLGGPLLWLTPEQGTFSAERLLLTDTGVHRTPGAFRAQVLSFRRLALLIARDVGLMADPSGRAAKPMDEVARVVLLEEMVRQQRPRLSVFASVADRPGFVKKLDATLRELRQHGHSGATLRALLDAPAPGLDAVMRRKLLDLAVLLDAWSQVVEQPDTWDFEYLMHQAALKMGASRLIVGTGAQDAAQVWVDAVSAMSALEIRLLVALGRLAGELTITLLADPDDPAIRDLRAATDGAENWGLFARTQRLHRRLIDAFRQHGVPLAQTLTLRHPHRFANAAIRRIEAELLEDRPASAPPPTLVPPAIPAPPVPAPPLTRGKTKRRGDPGPTLFDLHEPPPAATPAQDDRQKAEHPTESGGVEIWESSDPETEVRMAAQAIRDMAIGQSQPLRYRQIAVIVPELDAATGGEYQDAIRRIFTEHAIPHFIDARRSIAHHPLVEFLHSALAMVRARFDRDDMLLLLKTQLAGIADADVALVENYLIEHGITHMPWDQPWTWIAPNRRAEDADDRLPLSAHQRLARVNEIRAQVWETLRGFVTRLQEPQTAADSANFPRALRELLTTLHVEEQLTAWMDAARATAGAGGGVELAQIHQQVWREVAQLLDLLESILAGRQRTLAEFERLMDTALQSLTLGLIPPTVDQVLVSSVTRSRVPEMEVVLILGAVEGAFPRVVSEDAILSDAQRETFNALAADPIGEGSDRQLLEMPFFDYVALTRCRRRLIISYPLADRQGKALGRSRHLQRVRDLLGGELTTRTFDAASRTRLDRIATVDDLLAGVTGWARQVRLPEGAADADAPLMPAVYNWLVSQSDPDLVAARRQVWSSVGPQPAPCLSPAVAARFFPPPAPLRLSVSQLEQFAGCPLQYFAHYTLGLRSRVEFQIDQLSLGQLQHRILERVYRCIIAGEIDWPLCAPAQAAALLAREVDGAIEELHAEISRRTPGYDKLRARLKRVLGLMLEADRRRALQGETRPVSVELYFGKGSAPAYDAAGRLVSLPLLQLQGARRMIHISGKIDRMDEPESGEPQATVIDYKSAARKSLELFRVFHGIALQLPTYALVMRTLARYDPIGAFYIPLGLWRETLDHAAAAPAPGSDAFFQKLKPRGLVDSQHAWLLDRRLAQDGKSGWYQMKFNQDGTPAKLSDLLRHDDLHDDFSLLLTFTAWKIASLGDALAAGGIAPQPFRSRHEIPCTYCDYVSLCPFDPSRDTFQEVPCEKKNAVLTRMKQQLTPR